MLVSRVGVDEGFRYGFGMVVVEQEAVYVPGAEVLQLLDPDLGSSDYT